MRSGVMCAMACHLPLTYNATTILTKVLLDAEDWSGTLLNHHTIRHNTSEVCILQLPLKEAQISHTVLTVLLLLFVGSGKLQLTLASAVNFGSGPAGLTALAVTRFVHFD
jgi:hypothetical protein